MPPLKVMDTTDFGGVDTRSNPINMPSARFLRMRNWVPRPDGHLELRDGYVLSKSLAGPGTPIIGSETAHNVSANSAYNQTNFPANFTGTSYVSTTATVTVDKTKMDDSMNPVTPAHVSATSVKTLVPAFTGKWYVHLNAWFTKGGGGGHIDIGISVTDPNWVASALTDMTNRGFDGCTIDWYGKGHITDNVALLIQSTAPQHPEFTYAIVVDEGCYNNTANGDLTTQLKAHLAYISTQYFSDPNYMTHGGVPVVMFFGIVSGVDYVAARASVTTPMFWMFNNAGSASNSYADATFGWPSPYSTGVSSSDPYNLAADNFYMSSAGASGKPSMPSMAPGFNGTLTKTVSWSRGKYMPRDHGKCWITKANNIQTNLPGNAMGIQVVTWDDWEEGTEIESPIQNDIAITATLTGTVLSWSIAGGTGDDSTLVGYRVIATAAGATSSLLLLAEDKTSAPSGHGSVDLATLVGWSAGTTYSIYVVAVGAACIRNQFSNTVSYTPTTGGGGLPIHSMYSYSVNMPSVDGVTLSNPSVVGGVSLPPGQYYVVLAKMSGGTVGGGGLVTGASITGLSPELGPINVDASHGLQLNNIPYDSHPTTSWRVYFGIGPGGENKFIDYQDSYVASNGGAILITSGGFVGSPPPPNGTQCMLFWQETTPYVMRMDTLAVLTPVMHGAPVASSDRWSYALGRSGFIYMHNGTDKKFFDGAAMRDIGLPALTTDQVGGVQVNIWTAAMSAGQAGATTMVLHTLPVAPGFEGRTASQVFLSFFDRANNLLMNSPYPLASAPGVYTTPVNGNQYNTLEIDALPAFPAPSATVVGLLSILTPGAPGAEFVYGQYKSGTTGCSMSGTGNTVTVIFPSHGLSTGAVIVLNMGAGTGFPIKSIGPFAVTVSSGSQFTFNTGSENAADYNSPPGGVNFWQLQTVAWLGAGGSAFLGTMSTISAQGVLTGPTGEILLDYSNTDATSGIPGSAIGGAQPGYQFYASIYNPVGGQHIGNRFPIGNRIVPLGSSVINITGLPPLPDPEWVYLIGRTGDGGEIPYAVVDANGNWDCTASATQSTITVYDSQIDGNSELPTENDIPPNFYSFWREGDRMCGSVINKPFVYRSGSELDAQTGIFMGDPAQAWPPRLAETFPTAQPVIAGYGYMQESWVFTANDFAQLSELSGETAWNGPYNTGGAGRFCFTGGWQGLPFWLSSDKQLMTMTPNGNGPIPISQEYEMGELSKIGNKYLNRTEMLYYRDTVKQIELLRIKCQDTNGNPFIVVHDFNLRDQSTYMSLAVSPYGQGYDEFFNGQLGTDFTHIVCRDASGRLRVWAGGADGNFYQLYTSGQDSGNDFTADGISLRYVGAYNTAVKTLEWYGDQNVQWYIAERLDTVFDNTQWVNLSDEQRPVPGQDGDFRYMADLQRPEVVHLYVWAQLTTHIADAPNPSNPMQLNDPPHIPVENYGRIYLAAPLIGDSRGR